MQKIEIDYKKEEVFYKLIEGSASGSSFIKPIKALIELKTNYHFGQFEYHFICCLIKRYKKIILMDPILMQNWIKRIERCYSNKFHFINTDGKFAQTDFGKKLTKALDYERLQKKVLKEFFYQYQSNTCYYCNSQYTLIFKDEKLTSVKFQIDHIFPKKKYPYFSISLCNLVPSCANCNLNKGHKDYWIEEYYHPYLESIGEKFKFTLSKKSDKSSYSTVNNIDFTDISISLTHQMDKRVENHNKMFDLEGIYSNFTEIAKEIVALGYEYPESKRNELLNAYKRKNGKSMFENKETIDRIFLRVYPQKEKTNERPLSKFINDMARFSDFYDDK
jgi:HNH endonuclease